MAVFLVARSAPWRRGLGGAMLPRGRVKARRDAEPSGLGRERPGQVRDDAPHRDLDPRGNLERLLA